MRERGGREGERGKGGRKRKGKRVKEGAALGIEKGRIRVRAS